jgi:hypothetical protein
MPGSAAGTVAAGYRSVTGRANLRVAAIPRGDGAACNGVSGQGITLPVCGR